MKYSGFKGKVAIITGAGNGIGYVIARTFAEEGFQVVIADINESAGLKAAQEINEDGGKAISIPTDVSDEQQVHSMVEETVQRLGCVDILVNNAGITVHKELIELDREAWDRQIGVQLTGPFLVTKHVARQMIKKGEGGKIVNITSVAGQMGREKQAAYCSAKGGLIMLTKVAAIELAKYRINVNSVAPGLVDVPAQRDEETLSQAYKDSYLEQLPLGRIGLPEDIANVVLYLSSPEAEWITGQNYIVDGGLMAGHFSFKGTHDYAELYGHDKKN
jgi:NAD(P)-dependent dehydrogenase (short-subunit alcohol dehydrogenase family)